MKTVLGIFRAKCYSPGMAERDEAILRAVAKRLEETDYKVNLIHEEEFTAAMPMPDIVLHMTRSPQALQTLQAWQETGCRVINSVEGVRRVERAALAEWCASQGIPTPRTWIVDTANGHIEDIPTTDGQAVSISFPCWVKRTGDCAQQPDDVCRVPDAEAYAQCLAQFHTRGIARAVVMEHLDGPCIKFYAVRDTDFFYWLPAHKLGYDKFADAAGIPHSAETSHVNSQPFSLSLPHAPLAVYGGDAIIGTDGIARLIDLNDWPSFSACREEAADAIAALVMNIGHTTEPFL